MAKIRYRQRSTWKILVKYLNEQNSVLLINIEKHLFHSVHNYDMKRHLSLLIKLRFCERKVCFNQNKKTTTKIVLKRRIPKKLTEELANEMLKTPWLAWFMYPE